MASVALSRRVGKVVGYPPLSEMGDQQRRGFQEALLDADAFEELPGKWQAAIPNAEERLGPSGPYSLGMPGHRAFEWEPGADG